MEYRRRYVMFVYWHTIKRFQLEDWNILVLDGLLYPKIRYHVSKYVAESPGTVTVYSHGKLKNFYQSTTTWFLDNFDQIGRQNKCSDEYTQYL